MGKVLNFSKWNSSINENNEFTANSFNRWKTFEQSNDQSKYGKYEFDQLFPDNMVTPRKESYEPVIKQMADDLNKALSEKKKLSDIKINIISSASSRRATDAIPKGHTKLDHNYGGEEPNNEFLAKNRGVNIKKVIIEKLNDIGIPVTDDMINVKWRVSESPDPSEQYVKVNIEGLLSNIFKEPNPKKKYAYEILYNFYSIDNVPYIVNTKIGNGAPWTSERGENDDLRGEKDDLGKRKLSKYVPSNGILVKQGFGDNTGSVEYGIMIPIVDGYSAIDKGKLMFDNEDAYNKMKDYIESYTQISNTLKETGKPETGLVQTNFLGEQGGGGNYIFGKDGGSNATILQGDGAGKTIVIKRNWKPANAIA